MIGVGELTAYCSGVPAINLNCGSPSYLGDSVAALRVTVAVCGMVLASTASRACGVPATDTRAVPLG